MDLSPFVSGRTGILRHFLLAVFIFVAAIPGDVCAFQDDTREEEIRALRIRKSAALEPDKRNGLESALLWMQEHKVKEKLETPGAGFKGFRPRFGGLSTGSGFAYGVRYDKPRLGGQLDFSFSSAVSTRKYQLYEMKFDFPEILRRRAFLGFHMRYRNMPQEDYFGIGSRSRKQDRTDYLYEDSTFELTAGYRPVRSLSIGGRVGLLSTNVGPGTDRRFANTETLFDDSETPGLFRQSDFLRSEVFAEVDYRDSARNPRSGGLYRVNFSRYDARNGARFDFQRFESELQQYFPFNYGHRVVALRFLTSLDDAEKGHRVPFYLMKTLGGSNDLRGFREFRFRDLNQIVMNAEYRWEAWSGLDMALFGDAGKVFRAREDFNLKNLEGAFGIGFRFNTAKNVFWRIDVGHSREGTRLFINFNHVF